MVLPHMPREIFLIIFITVIIGLLIVGIFSGISLARRALDVRHHALSGVMQELKKWIPDLKGMQIGKTFYAMGSLEGRKIGFKYIPLPGRDETRSMPGQGPGALQIRMKIQETERYPFYLRVYDKDPPSHPSMGGWSRRENGIYIGGLSGVSLEEQEERYRRLSGPTKAALRNLASVSLGEVAITPDWEINRIGRDAALRLLEQDGVALTQLELQTTWPEEGDGRALINHIKHMQRVVQMLERELP